MEVIFSFETGGSEMLAADLASHFHTRGVSVSVCSTHGGYGPISRRLAGAGIACHPLAGETRSRARRLHDLYRLFRRERVDVLHIQHLALLPICYWPAKLAGVRRIVTTEHNEIFVRESPKLRRRARRYCRRIDAVTVIHGALGDYLQRELQLPSATLHLIPNGVDTARFSPGDTPTGLRAALDMPENAVLAGCIGRLHEHKGHRDLLRAAKKARREFEGFRLVIVGDGPLRESLQSCARQERLGDTVHFVGERSDIDTLLKGLDMVVLSSETEGVPMVLLEAMSTGVPCVATAVGGVPELIMATGGRVVPPKDPQALAEAILALCRSPESRRAIAAKARRRVAENYDTRRVFEAYGRLLFPAGGC